MRKKLVGSFSKLRSSEAMKTLKVSSIKKTSIDGGNSLSNQSRAFQKASPSLNHSTVDPLIVDTSLRNCQHLAPTTEETPSDEQTSTLDLKDYKEWSPDVVAYVMVLGKHEGGAGLPDFEKFRPINKYFCGRTLFMLQTYIFDMRNSGPTEACIEYAAQLFVDGSVDTPELSNKLRKMVEWVAINLVPKSYQRWSTEETMAILCKPKAEGGAGLSMEELLSLEVAGFAGYHLFNIVMAMENKGDVHDINYRTKEVLIRYGAG